MNRSIVKLLLCSITLASAETPAITNVWLNERVVTEIPVGLHRVTTLNFPSTIQSVDAAGLTADGKTPGLFQVAHQPGQSSLALRALVPGGSANVNIRVAQSTHVLLLKESQNPVLAVNFLAPAPAARPTPATSVEPAASALTTSQLIGLLDRSRAYDQLKQHHPRMVAEVTVARPRSTNDYETFTVVLEEVFRFDLSDALVFHVTLRNKTATEVRYRAGSWAVRIGERLYPQTLADSDGLIPAHGESGAWFVIQGSPDGRRNGLSVRNPFIVLVNPL